MARPIMETIPIFPQYLWRFDIRDRLNWRDLKERSRAVRYNPEHKLQGYKSNIAGWQSNTELFMDGNGFEDLRSALIDCHIEIVEQVGLQGYWAINAMWCNVNYPHSQNSIHHHAHNPNEDCDNLISGVVWIDIPSENSGRLRMYNCRCLQELYGWFKDSRKIAEMAYYDIEPQEGIAYFFNAGKMHDVSENLSGENRISFSFNFEVVAPEKAKQHMLETGNKQWRK